MGPRRPGRHSAQRFARLPATRKVGAATARSWSRRLIDVSSRVNQCEHRQPQREGGCQSHRWADSPFSRTAGSCRRVIRVINCQWTSRGVWTCDLMTERRFAHVQLDRGGPRLQVALQEFSTILAKDVSTRCATSAAAGWASHPAAMKGEGGASLSKRRSRRFRHLFRGRKRHESSFLHDKGIRKKTKSQLASTGVVVHRSAETETAGR